jgi:hypothetical protein
MGALQLSPQVLDGSQLKLFHRALTPSQQPGNLADALLLDEPQPDDLCLRFGQPIDQLKQDDVAFDLLRIVALGPGHGVTGLPARPPVVIRDGTRCDPQEPRHERHALPLETAQARERLAKDVCGQVLGLMTVADAARDVGVHTGEILLVQFAETGRIPLRVLNPQPVVGTLRHRLASPLLLTNPSKSPKGYGGPSKNRSQRG